MTKRPNQAMQRTASEAATDVWRVCPPRFGCVARCIGSRSLILCLVRCVSVCAQMASAVAHRPFRSVAISPAASAGEESVSCRPVRLRERGGTPTSRASSRGATLEFRARVSSRVLVPCRGVTTTQPISESLGSTSCVLPPVTPNQAMQLTGTALHVTFGVASESSLRATRALVPAADLVSR